MEPRGNDWVYMCPKGMATSEVAAVLGVVGQPVTEVSAQTWQQDAQMANSFMEAYNAPREWRWLPGEQVGWGLFEEQMVAKSEQTERTASGRIATIRFVGELIMVRQSLDAAENTLAFLLDVVQARIEWSRKHPQARIVVVLEGWDRPVIEGKTAKLPTWIVNPLPLPPTTGSS